MRALELSLRNYRVFEEVDLELPARVIGILKVPASPRPGTRILLALQQPR